MFRRHPKLTVIACLALGFFVVWPTVNALRVRSTVSAALRQAESVRLEEFAFHNTLTSVELPHAQWPQILAAIPIRPDAGVPGLVKACFIPHHRVVVTDQRHQPFEFTVCFACDQASIKGMGIFATPYLWCSSLRRLFSSHGIRLRTDREYIETVTADWPRT